MNINTIALISAALVHTSNSFAIRSIVAPFTNETLSPSDNSTLPLDWSNDALSTTIASNSISGNSDGTITTTINNATDATSFKITDVMNAAMNSASATVGNSNGTLSTTDNSDLLDLVRDVVTSVTSVFSIEALVGLSLGFFLLSSLITIFITYRCLCKE